MNRRLACVRCLPPAFVILLLGTVSTSARADDRAVTVAETPVRSAPVEVAPEIGRLHAGDVVHADDQPQGPWRRVALPNGRYGFVHDADTEHSATPLPGGPTTGSPVSAGSVASPAPVLVQQPESSAASTEPHLLGLMFELLPVGTLATTNTTGASISNDSVFAVSVAPFFDGALSPYFALGLSPQAIFRVKGDGSSSESAKEFDFRARLTARLPLSRKLRVFGRLSPAYSIILPPPAPPGTNAPTRSDPHGFLIDLSAGVEIAVLPNFFLLTDLGYQAGFQSNSDGDVHTSYLHLGAGFAIGL